MSKPPFIQATDRNPWGESVDPEALIAADRDATYIEGYSDVRTARELAQRQGKRVAPLRHRLQLVRAKNMTGTAADGRMLHHWRANKRYNTISYDELVKLGYRVDRNPAFTKGEDGLAYNGDSVVMIATAEVAAANYQRFRADQEAFENAPAARMEEAAAKEGTAAFTEIEIGGESVPSKKGRSIF